MSEQVPFGSTDFASNPEPRVPCVLLLDTSGSMQGERIEQLKDGVSILASSLASDPLSSKRVELAIVTFGGGAKVLQDFTTIDGFQSPNLIADGDTQMGAAIDIAVDMVASRKVIYRSNGVSYYRPWIFLITDGAPTDHWQEAARKIQEGERQRSFVFFSIGVEDADMSVLKQIGKAREPLKPKGLRFADMFQWLSSSLSSVSRSRTTDTSVPIEDPTKKDTGWGSV